LRDEHPAEKEHAKCCRRIALSNLRKELDHNGIRLIFSERRDNSSYGVTVHSVIRIFLLTLLFAITVGSRAEAQMDGVVTREISFLTDDTLLIHGTLWLPAKRKHLVPCVIFVHGSGPQTRDEASKIFTYDSSFKLRKYNWSTVKVEGLNLEIGRAKVLMGLLGKDTLASEDTRFVRYRNTVKVFRDIAIALARNGIASLTYDKRSYTYGKLMIGMGLPADPAALGGLDDYARDLRVAFTYAASILEIDKNRRYILGHSEGASGIAQLVALQERKQVRGVILLAAASEPIERTFHQQLSGTPAAQIVDSLLQLIRANGPTSDNIWALNASGSYWKSWMHMTDSAVAYTLRLRCPILMIHGSLDINVNAHNALTYDSLLRKNKPRPDYQMKIIPGLDHFMRLPWETTVDARVERAIIDWIQKH
jgi:pimeloyl-ACP methyl ester carboxylesterase